MLVPKPTGKENPRKVIRGGGNNLVTAEDPWRWNSPNAIQISNPLAFWVIRGLRGPSPSLPPIRELKFYSGLGSQPSRSYDILALSTFIRIRLLTLSSFTRRRIRPNIYIYVLQHRGSNPRTYVHWDDGMSQIQPLGPALTMEPAES